MLRVGPPRPVPGRRPRRQRVEPDGFPRPGRARSPRRRRCSCRGGRRPSAACAGSWPAPGCLDRSCNSSGMPVAPRDLWFLMLSLSIWSSGEHRARAVGRLVRPVRRAAGHRHPRHGEATTATSPNFGASRAPDMIFEPLRPPSAEKMLSRRSRVLCGCFSVSRIGRRRSVSHPREVVRDPVGIAHLHGPERRREVAERPVDLHGFALARASIIDVRPHGCRRCSCWPAVPAERPDRSSSFQRNGAFRV